MVLKCLSCLVMHGLVVCKCSCEGLMNVTLFSGIRFRCRFSSLVYHFLSAKICHTTLLANIKSQYLYFLQNCLIYLQIKFVSTLSITNQLTPMVAICHTFARAHYPPNMSYILRRMNLPERNTHTYMPGWRITAPLNCECCCRLAFNL